VPLVSGKNTKAAWPFVLVAVLCAVAIVGVLTGATSPLSAAQFANTGHWVYNSVLGSVFHVDGATTNIDAQLPLDAEDGSQVLQGDSSGFVVGPGRITEFDKASLSPKPPVAPPSDEFPLGIEVVGGPYAVYRNAGTVVRLGDPTATISAGGAIGNPVVTDDGTMWLHRTGNGEICRIAKDAVDLSGCPVSAPEDHAGALTVVDDRPAFVDTFTSRLHTIDGEDDGAEFGAGVPLGVRLSPNSRPAPRDADGRLAILDPERSSLVLVDTGNSRAKPVRVALPSGEYDGPVSTGGVVALVDRQKGRVLTFGADGRRVDEAQLEKKDGRPRLHQGEDERIYVEDADGTQVLVVADDGEVTDVDVTAKPTTTTPVPTQTSGAPTGTGTPTGTPTGPPATSETPDTTPPPVPPSRPGAPPAVAAQPGDRSAVVTWGTAQDNRAPLTSYVVTWQTGEVTVAPGARQVTVDGLTNGVSYTFTVTATNRIGAGPGASSAPVVPFAAAAAPPVSAQYANGAATVSWSQPDLRGGTLVHYLVTATGQPDRTVPGTSTVYNGLSAGQTVTFTVRAVTTTGGRTVNGAPGTASVTIPARSVSIVQGGPSETDNCHAPDCAWVNATMTGFAPNTTYDLRLSSNANEDVNTERFTTDASGAATYNELNYDVPGETVWVSVLTPEGPVPSNAIVWE
jgi:hypothetical protein